MKRYKHSLSHYRVFNCDMGKLVPIACIPVLPGDTVQMQSSALVRIEPLDAPVMHPVIVSIEHWYVPNRLVWSPWGEFITGFNKDGTTNTDTIPQITPTADNPFGVIAQLGGPQLNGVAVNALPVYAYNFLFNEEYRDQDLVPERLNTDHASVATVAWEKDYYTDARPWPQKGDAVVLPDGS